MKRFAAKFILFFGVLLFGIAYYVIYVQSEISGDLGRLGQIPFGKTNISNTQQHKFVSNFSDSIVECLPQDTILTIGDSFSQQGIKGYQQMLGNKLSQHIINIPRHNGSPEQTFIRLINNKNLLPHSTVIIESVERAFVKRLANLNFEDTASVCIKKNNNTETTQNVSLEDYASWIRLRMGYKNPVSHCKLHKDCFSQRFYSNDLYFYNSEWDNDGDFQFLQLDSVIYTKALANLHLLKQMAETNNITMIYVVAADKYDVYTPYIVDNAYPQNPTMNYFADLDTTWFVDTKRLLQPYIEAGMKDVYYVNDTHWSPVGAKIVGEHIATMLSNELDSLGIIH